MTDLQSKLGRCTGNTKGSLAEGERRARALVDQRRVMM